MPSGNHSDDGRGESGRLRSRRPLYRKGNGKPRTAQLRCVQPGRSSLPPEKRCRKRYPDPGRHPRFCRNKARKEPYHSDGLFPGICPKTKRSRKTGGCPHQLSYEVGHRHGADRLPRGRRFHRHRGNGLGLQPVKSGFYRDFFPLFFFR